MSNTRILIADDHQMFRTGIANLFKKEEDFIVIGEASDGAEAVSMALLLKPDVILMDIHLPVLNGIEATNEIIVKYPEAKILALTSFENEEYVLSMVKAGAKGYILKEAPFEELVLAVKIISKGNSFFDKEITPKLFTNLDPHPRVHSAEIELARFAITKREMEILRHIAQELASKEIAAKLHISPRTVETHRRNLIQKLKVRNTAGLVKFFLETTHENGRH